MSQLAARVPVGFRFHPTDEELVGYYLPKKVGAMKIDLDLIRDSSPGTSKVSHISNHGMIMSCESKQGSGGCMI
jgi:hypothetical protein